jgi:peptide/nickel transport system substrate-binding protein
MSHAIRTTRLAAIAACLFLIAAVVSACGSSGSKSSASSASSSASATSTSAAATGTPKPGGSLTVLELGGYAGAWPTGLDPATNVNGAADQDQMNSIFGQLFQIARVES